MPLNQLYHDHGVARTKALHAGTADLREAGRVQSLLADHSIREERGLRGPPARIDPDRFEIFRSDEVQLTSTLFSGGDWCWRLADASGATLVRGEGYSSKRACLVAVSLLRNRAFAAR
jgi:uncharacterized protein YegP (UPF0339 family)